MHRAQESAVLRTLAFYELFGVGRTVEQLAPFVVDTPMTAQEVSKVVTNLVRAGRIYKIGNQYGLTVASAARTSQSADWAEKKRPIANRIATTMHQMPFIRLVAVTQSVAMETAGATSDVDIFTVTAPHRLWTARFLAMVRLKLAGLAKRHGSTADHGCFGFWVDATALNLNSIAIPDDIYLAFWLAHLVPLVDSEGTYTQLIAANRSLLKQFPNWRATKKSIILTEKSMKKTSIIEWILGGHLGNWLEAGLFKLQSKKIWRDDIAHRSGASVVANPTMVKLHHFDKRAELRDRWQASIATNADR